MVAAGFNEQVFKQEFNNTLLTLPSQRDSRIWGLASITPIRAEQMFVDTVGTLKAYRDNSKNAKPQPTELAFARRQVSTERILIQVNVDPRYQAMALMDPMVQGHLAGEAMAAIKREFDKLLYERMFADVKTGKQGETTLTFAQDGGRTVDLTGGWTYDSWITLMRLFASKEIGLDGNNKVVVGVTDDEQSIFMDTAELNNTLQANSFSQMRDSLGFKSILGHDIITFGSNPDEHDPILTVSGGTRTCFIMARDAMMGVIRENITTEVVPLKETSIDTIQLRISAEIGAVRKLGTKVAKILTTALAAV